MSLSLAEIRRVGEELEPLVVGGRLDQAHSGGPTTVLLTLYAQRAKRHVLVAVEPRFARFHLVGERPRDTGPVPPFVRAVRQTLRGRSLVALDVAVSDRIVALCFGHPDQPAGRLVAELTGRTSNLYLLGPTGKVVAALRSTRKAERDLRPGCPYEPPPPAPATTAAERDRFAGSVAAGEFPSYSEAVERFYAEAEAHERLRSLRSALTSHIKAARKRALRLLAKLEGDLAATDDADHLRLCGELLKLHLHEIEPRQLGIAVPNAFAPGSPDVEIPLRSNLNAQQNMERYFRRYKKLREARRQADARAAGARQRVDELDRQAITVQEAHTVEALEALAAELGIGKGRRPQRRRAPLDGPYRFVSADGLDILVARTNVENDELTFRIARGNDLWLHVEGYTGSHVVVRVPKGKSVPRETLLDAATLAVHFSQLRRAGGGPVAYCACKHVTKPRDAGPGRVLYSQSKTLQFTVERARLARLLGKG